MRSVLVGCGAIAPMHAEALQSCADTELAACCDIVRERADVFSAKYGGNSYTDLEEMLQSESPDVLHICTPHYLHLPMAEMAARYGVHVFTEKPPVITPVQLDAFLKVEEAVCVGVCFQNRYNSENRYVKEALLDGVLGRILGARATVFWSRGANYYASGDWRGTIAEEGGGVLINQAIHTLDLMVHFLGEPLSVEAVVSNFSLKNIIEVEDTLNACIHFGDARGLFFATNAYAEDAPVSLEIVGDKGRIAVEEQRVLVSMREEEPREIRFDKEEGGGKSYWGASHVACIHDFYACLRDGRDYPVSLSAVLPTTRLMLSSYLSARTGAEVDVRTMQTIA